MKRAKQGQNTFPSQITERPDPPAPMRAITNPNLPGAFNGDIWFGHPEKRNLGTHRWNGDEWEALPDEIESVLVLLAKEKAESARLGGLLVDWWRDQWGGASADLIIAGRTKQGMPSIDETEVALIRAAETLTSTPL